MLYKQLVTVSLSVYAFLTSQIIGSTYRVSPSGLGHICTDESNGTCDIYCDLSNGAFKETFDCSNAGTCNFYCDDTRCARSTIINATLSNHLHIMVGANGDECMRSATVYAPNHGNATLHMGNSNKGFLQMKVYAGTATQSLVIDINSTQAVGGDANAMEVYASSAKQVHISVSNGNEWSAGILECPLLSSFVPVTTAPCIVDASHGNGILTNTDIYAPDGIPYNFWILDGIYTGTNTLWCANIDGYNGPNEGGSSIAPFTVNSDCWYTANPTKSPTYNPSSNPTVSPTNPTVNPTQSPTDSTFHPTSIPSNSPSRIPSLPPTRIPSYSPTQLPSNSPTQPPSNFPTQNPSNSPTEPPSIVPTQDPSYSPTQPSNVPSQNPSYGPTHPPSNNPTQNPSYSPTESTTNIPTLPPSLSPFDASTAAPSTNTDAPTTTAPTTVSPSTASPTMLPTTDTPTTPIPTSTPSSNPSIVPTIAPTTGTPTTSHPTTSPSAFPSKTPTFTPTTATPTTANPTAFPSASPSRIPTRSPTLIPTVSPTTPTIPPTTSPSHSPTTATPSVPPTTSEPSVTPTSAPSYAPKYWICDEDCYHQSAEVDKLQIKVSYSFAEDITYDLRNMECFLYQIFEPLFEKYQFVDTFTICDIEIDDIDGGTERNPDESCEFAPCLRFKSDANSVPNRRVLLQSVNSDPMVNAAVTIIAYDTSTYSLINSLSRKGMKTQFAAAFMDAFALSVDVGIHVTNGNELGATKFVINPLWYIIGGLVILLFLILCLLCWYIARSRMMKRKLSRQQSMEEGEGDNLKTNEFGTNLPHTVQRVGTNSSIPDQFRTNNLVPIFLVGDTPIHNPTTSSVDFGVYTQASLRDPKNVAPSDWYAINAKSQHLEMVGHNPLYNPNPKPEPKVKDAQSSESEADETVALKSVKSQTSNTSPPVISVMSKSHTPVVTPNTPDWNNPANPPHAFHNTFHHHSMKRSSDRGLVHYPGHSRSASLDRTRAVGPPVGAPPPANNAPWMQYPPTMNWDQYSTSGSGRDLNQGMPPNANNQNVSQAAAASSWNRNYNQYQHAMKMHHHQMMAHQMRHAQPPQHGRHHSDGIDAIKRNTVSGLANQWNQQNRQQIPPQNMQQVAPQNVQPHRGKMQQQKANVQYLRPTVRHQLSSTSVGTEATEEGSGSNDEGSDTNMRDDSDDDEYDAKTQFPEHSRASQDTEHHREDTKKVQLKAAIVDPVHASSVSKGMLVNMSNLLEFQKIDCEDAPSAMHQVQNSGQTNVTMIINDPNFESEMQPQKSSSVNYKEFLPNSGNVLDVLIDEDMIVSDDENDTRVMKPSSRKHNKRENTQDFHRKLTMEAKGTDALMEDVVNDIASND